MNLQVYLDNTIVCTVEGFCRRCPYVGILERVSTNPCMHVMYRCPKCNSINAVVTKVSEPVEDRTIVIYERN